MSLINGVILPKAITIGTNERESVRLIEKKDIIIVAKENALMVKRSDIKHLTFTIRRNMNPDIRKIKKVDKNGNIIKVIEVDWNKLPCSKCERRYHFTCPKDCWNKKGEYDVY